EIERDLAVVERADLIEAVVRRRDPDDGREAVLVPNAPQRLVGGIEHDVADARVLEEHALGARVDVYCDNVAEGAIVFSVIGRPRGGIEGKAGDAIEHDALDLLELGQLASREIHASEE